MMMEIAVVKQMLGRLTMETVLTPTMEIAVVKQLLGRLRM